MRGKRLVITLAEKILKDQRVRIGYTGEGGLVVGGEAYPR